MDASNIAPLDKSNYRRSNPFHLEKTMFKKTVFALALMLSGLCAVSATSAFAYQTGGSGHSATQAHGGGGGAG
jgi:hypothetical protein